MKILLIGFGSIGKRHLGNLFLSGYKDIDVVTRNALLPEPYEELKLYSSLQNALANSTYDTAIICTPTAQHTTAILQLLQAQVYRIYIEKPVSHSLADLELALSLSASYPNKIVVGFDLHFDLGLQKVRELLFEQTIGKIISINAQVGQYLPDWRPAEDYRQGMSAKRETGGGVMLDLVHEFDYVTWLAGPVKTIAALYKNSGSLQIETEDIAEVLLQFESGAIGTIHLDYLQPALVRNCLINGAEGTIKWNLAENTVEWGNHEKEFFSYSYAGFERNERFVQIMKSFLQDEADERLTNIQDGIESLKLVVAAKQSCDTQQFVSISDLKFLTKLNNL
ncbi:MAG: Gfo/Idh/MocA family oxidoreductase [Chitinophagaceae bacterium]|nr:Gfo/Idh/MocA family oxidoreductase [Chitinophagaceae bacterium]